MYSSSFRLVAFVKHEPVLPRWLHLAAPAALLDTQQSAAVGLTSSKTTACGLCSPMLSSYARLPDERVRALRLTSYNGRLHDIMGMSPESHLHRDVRVERIIGRSGAA